MATIVNARDVILQAASPRILPVSLPSNITSIPNTVTVTGYSTLGQIATDSSNAISQVGSKLNKASSDVLSGTISVATAGGFKAGTITWDSVGNVTSGSGVAMTAKGIVGASGGSPTFSIDINGNAYYYGAVSANQISGGTVTASSISTTGYGIFNGQTPSPIIIDGISKNPTLAGLNNTADIGVYGQTAGGFGVYGNDPSGTGTGVRGTSSGLYAVWGQSSTGRGVYGQATGGGVGVYGQSTSSGGIGVYARAATGTGLYTEATASGGIALSANSAIGTGTALQVNGTMTINNANLVTNLNADLHDGYNAGNSSGQIPVSNGTTCTNLNADMLDGNHSSAFATASHTHSIYPSQFVTQSGTGNISAGTVYFYTSTGLTAYQFFSDGGGSVGMRSVSDSNLKQDIAPETLDISFIRKLNPVSYRMKSDTSVKHHGFIAQDVEPLLPDYPDSLKMQYKDGVKGMDYLALIAPIVKAIQQIDERLIKIEEKLNA